MAGTNPPNITAAQRRETALNLRVAGLTFAQIGEQVGVSRQRAAQYVQQELKNIAKRTKDSAETLRQMQLERLDRLLLGVWRKAIKGENQSVGNALKIMESQAKLSGLNAPLKQAITDSEGNDLPRHIKDMSNEELQARLAELRKDLGDDGPSVH